MTGILGRLPLLAKWSGRMIQIKTPHEIELMRGAGLVVAGAIRAVVSEIRPGITTGELDAIAEDHIRTAGAVPSFLGYHGFTGSICASINNEIVHGIPDRRRALAEGDNISIDCGAILQGWHGDSAVTVTVGEPSAEDAALLAVTERSMWAGLARAIAGGRLTDISAAVEEAITAESHPYGIVDHYGGHGIGTEMHQDPHVLNYGRPGKGPRLVPGMALAIEPMVTLRSAGTPGARPRAGTGNALRHRSDAHARLAGHRRTGRRVDGHHPGPVDRGTRRAHRRVLR